ncbi:uncharacterized protein [Amphiura filiformis]|uniref:uncharacterized protein n=1 Tax=Amphiura filiformis TaxID=82378 RepID=UPI003B2249C1
MPQKEDLKNYFYYEGSITTPMCNEGVQWIVYETPIEVSLEQLQALRSVYENKNEGGSTNTHLADNFRPPQLLNGRKVYVAGGVRMDPSMALFPFYSSHAADWSYHGSNGNEFMYFQVALTGDFYIRGGPLKATYQTGQFHFHVGSDNSKGSEHTMNGEQYPGEMHIVHWNRDNYKSFEEALGHKNGVAVLGVLIKIGKRNPTFDKLVNVIDKVKFKGDRYTLPMVFPIAALMPDAEDLQHYFYYNGSLTMPHCNEGFTWIVYREPIELSSDQVWPANWPAMFPQYCAGVNQSPINIKSIDAEYQYAGPIELHGYRAHDIPNPSQMDFTNNGHTVVVGLIGDFFIRGGPLKATYQAAQFHFHWGSIDSQGSEHTLNGKQYPAEMHIVHWDRDNYKTIEDALNSGDSNAVAVLGVFFEVGEQNPTFDNLVHAIDKVKFKDDKYTLPTVFPIAGLMPQDEDLEEYFYYNGSLTSPYCNEVIQWIVYGTPIEVSSDQIAAFRSVYENETDTSRNLVDNFRPTQPLNDRIFYSAKASILTHPSVGEQNLIFDKLVDVIDKVKFKDDQYTFPQEKVFPIAGLMPDAEDLQHYYYYDGSLTTPHCNEVVQWIVYAEPIEVSSDQVCWLFN